MLIAPVTTASWVDGIIASLDFETTGTNPLEDRMVSVSLTFLDVDGTDVGGVNCLVNPGIEIPEGASAIHGISTEKAFAEGPNPFDVLLELKSNLQYVKRQGIPVCIFNAPFDWPLLHAEAARHGVTGIPNDLYLLDPLLMDRVMDRFRRGGKKLTAVAAHYGIDLTDAHDAAADAIASVGVVRAIGRKFSKVGSQSLAELQQWQRTAFDGWARGINKYWADTGSASRVEGTWPGVGHA